MIDEKSLVVFQGKDIRRTWFNDEWWFSVVDIVEALTESGRARKYWSDLKKRLTEEGFELSAKIGQLKLEASDRKKYLTDCADTETVFRIIQSHFCPLYLCSRFLQGYMLRRVYHESFQIILG